MSVLKKIIAGTPRRVSVPADSKWMPQKLNIRITKKAASKTQVTRQQLEDITRRMWRVLITWCAISFIVGFTIATCLLVGMKASTLQSAYDNGVCAGAKGVVR